MKRISRDESGKPRWDPAQDCGPDERAQEYAARYRAALAAWEEEQR